MNKSDLRELLLTRKEAASVLKISMGTLDSLRKAGVIPTVRVGNLVRICANDLRSYVESQRTWGE